MSGNLPEPVNVKSSCKGRCLVCRDPCEKKAVVEGRLANEC